MNILNGAVERQKFWPDDKNSGMELHDHKSQKVSKVASKAAENRPEGSQCPGTYICEGIKGNEVACVQIENPQDNPEFLVFLAIDF